MRRAAVIYSSTSFPILSSHLFTYLISLLVRVFVSFYLYLSLGAFLWFMCAGPHEPMSTGREVTHTRGFSSRCSSAPRVFVAWKEYD